MESTEASNSSYKTILKATSILASVRVVTIVVNILKNKFIAILLGTSGVGLLGIFSTTLNLINSISDLGLSKSSVRNIAVAKASDEPERLSRTIKIFRILLFVLSLGSSILTLVFARKLSIYSFGSSDYTWSFAWLALAVFFTSISTGQLAILQGLRRLKLLAQASTYGAVLGLLTSVPLFYYYGERGIVPSLIVSSLAALLLTAFFLKRIPLHYAIVSRNEIMKEGGGMVKLGIAMMVVSFSVALSGFVLRAFINKESGVESVGLFQAGFTIITSYFGLIFTAMTTDYFPRISAISEEDKKIELEVNQQSIVALILITPLIVLLLFLMPVLIETLYSSQFVGTINYVSWAIFGVIFQAPGQSMGMILIAKNRSLIFVLFVIAFQLIFLLISVSLYRSYGLEGLGIAFSINMALNMLGSQLLIKFLYNISFSIYFYKILTGVVLFSVLAFLFRDLENVTVRFGIGFLLTILSGVFTLGLLKKVLGITSVSQAFKNQFNRKK